MVQKEAHTITSINGTWILNYESIVFELWHSTSLLPAFSTTFNSYNLKTLRQLQRVQFLKNCLKIVKVHQWYVMY